MNKVTDFHIIAGHSTYVDRVVNEMICNGYELHGELMKVNCNETDILAQGVIKRKETRSVVKIQQVCETHYTRFTNKVNEWIKNGYQIYGQPSILNLDRQDPVYNVTMVMYEEN